MACAYDARVDPSREGQLDMVGVFNLCRARPRQMAMGRVVSPLLAILASGGPPLSTRAVGRCQSRDEKGTPPTLLRSRDGSSRWLWSRATGVRGPCTIYLYPWVFQ